MRIYEPTIRTTVPYQGKGNKKGAPTMQNTFELYEDNAGRYHLFLFEKGNPSPVYAHFYDEGRKQVDVDLKAVYEGLDYSYWEGNDLPEESYEAVLNDPMNYTLIDEG